MTSLRLRPPPAGLLLVFLDLGRSLTSVPDTLSTLMCDWFPFSSHTLLCNQRHLCLSSKQYPGASMVTVEMNLWK